MEEEVKPADPQKRGRKPKVESVVNVSCVAIEISCSPDGVAQAAEAKFYELMDGSGGVFAVNDACGGSAYFKSIDEFPKSNRRCTCGKVGHFMVKYNIK